jgi:hypothetical protein
MTVVESLAFAGHEIPIVGGALDGDPTRSWRLIAWAMTNDSTLPADGWLRAATSEGEIVAWGTLIDRTSVETTDRGRYCLTFADAIEPADAAAPLLPSQGGAQSREGSGSGAVRGASR